MAFRTTKPNADVSQGSLIDTTPAWLRYNPTAAASSRRAPLPIPYTPTDEEMNGILVFITPTSECFHNGRISNCSEKRNPHMLDTSEVFANLQSSPTKR